MFEFVTSKRAVTRIQTVIIVAVLIIAVVSGAAYVFVMLPKPSAEPIAIGVVTPLSPPGAYGYGHFIRRASYLAEKYINQQGGILGRPVKLVIEDDSGTPEKGVAATEKLITKDKIVAAVGQVHSSVTLAVQDVHEKYSIPLLITSSSSVKITERGLPYTFRMHIIDPDRVTFWLKWIKVMNFKKVAQIAEDTDYGLGLNDEMGKQKPAEVEYKSVVISFKAVDATAHLLELKAWKPDLVIVTASGALFRLILSQSYDIGLFPGTPHLGAADYPVEPGYWDALGAKGEKIYWTSYYHPAMKLTSLGAQMKSLYIQEYNEEPTYNAFNAYAEIMVIKQAIEKANSADPKAIADALRKGTFISWNSEKVVFPQEKGRYFQHFSTPLIVLQFTKVGQDIKDATVVYQ
ncbi:ABC transporter substrate-binding protein [Candidatus Bathyarchaeota archaeon]|nr:ABC transporter substrate-binding protein [Candidatus Bathyarchaeota archaeon]